MTEFHARGPHADRDQGSFDEPFHEPQSGSQPEGSLPSDPTPAPGADDAAQGGDAARSGERRRRRRGGRRRRGAARPGGDAEAPTALSDAELAVEPPLPEAEFPPFDIPDRGEFPLAEGASAIPGGEPIRKRRRRGRRRGRGRDAQGGEELPELPPGAEIWPADSSLEPARDTSPGSAVPFVAHPSDPLLPGAAADAGAKRRRGRRRRGGSAPAAEGARNNGEPLAEQAPAARAAVPPHASPAASSKRRRRGGRGRGRERVETRGSAGPLGVEQIPFEDDDLPIEAAAPAPAAVAPRAKRRAGRQRHEEREQDADAELEHEHEPVKPPLRRKNVILVNAADREEVRVAVVEGNLIVDFQMTVRKHKLLVNDIYRGRVVNLEPAIGAAFVDFGQGRNGFLHTSDVLSVYGEPDFSLQKLLAAKIDPDEWQGDDSQADEAPAGREPQESAPAAQAAPAPRDESGEAAAAGEGSEEFLEIVDDHHELHAESGALHDEAAANGRHEHDDEHSDLLSDVHDLHDERQDEVHEEAVEDGDLERPSPASAEAQRDFDAEWAAAEAERDLQRAEEARNSAQAALENDSRAQGGERSLRKSRGAARTAAEPHGRGGPRGRQGQQFGNGTRRQARPRRPITELLQKGQVVVVQITKDAIGEKGPTLTTYISIPGRHLVLMPSMARTGVSRKIEDEKERRRLKKILTSLRNLPPGMGVIVRTAGVGCSREDLQRDLDYLLALWADFETRLNLGRGPAPLYEESDVAIRTVRDLFNSSTDAVIVDDPEVYQRVREFTTRLMAPEDLERIKLHDGAKPLFHTYGVEQDFERIFSRRIELPSGGSIVFDQTEALVAIDVNSGKTRSEGFEFEEIALKTNLEAAPEIARQIRLRDLGGIIVCDFIDMQRAGNRRAVERAFRNALVLDRARSKLGRISQFGLLELTRQRLGPGLSKMLFHNCSRCRGSGRVRTVESRSGSILRRLGAALPQKGFAKVEVRAAADVVDYLKAHAGAELKELQTRHQKDVSLMAVADQLEDSVLRYLRPDGREVRPGGRRKR